MSALVPLALLLAAFVGTNAAGVFDSINLSLTTQLPLWEPLLEDYFPKERGGEPDENGLASPVVVTRPTREEFWKHARRGYPLLVKNWAENMTYNGWDCKKFADAFPFGYMKAEYISHMPGFNDAQHDMKIIDGEKRFNIATFKPDTKTIWHKYNRPAHPKYGDDPLKPDSGPYVWHVKDELKPNEKLIVQERFEVPEFLSDPLNRHWMNKSFEVWFSPGAKTGAGAHNDGYCESVVSFQVNGAKKWRKMAMPEMTFLDSFDEFDGGVYGTGRWKPDVGFVNDKASAVVWPPGYMHETNSLATEDGSCVTSVTAQYAFPQPVQFYRNFLPRLSLSSEVGHCVHVKWGGYAIFFLPGIEPTPEGAAIQQQHATIMSALDSNKDGFIDLDETIASFKQNRELRGEAAYNYQPEHHDLFFKFKAGDTVSYHDFDADMRCSSQELLDSLTQWNVVRVRMKKGLEFVNNADLKGLKDFETSLDHLRRTPAEFPKRMRPELAQVFRDQRKPLFAEGRVPLAMSDAHFFDPLRRSGGNPVEGEDEDEDEEEPEEGGEEHEQDDL